MASRGVSGARRVASAAPPSATRREEVDEEVAGIVAGDLPAEPTSTGEEEGVLQHQDVHQPAVDSKLHHCTEVMLAVEQEQAGLLMQDGSNQDADEQSPLHVQMKKEDEQMAEHLRKNPHIGNEAELEKTRQREEKHAEEAELRAKLAAATARLQAVFGLGAVAALAQTPAAAQAAGRNKTAGLEVEACRDRLLNGGTDHATSHAASILQTPQTACGAPDFRSHPRNEQTRTRRRPYSRCDSSVARRRL